MDGRLILYAQGNFYYGRLPDMGDDLDQVSYGRGLICIMRQGDAAM
jgi:hypothetical protein